MFGLNISFKCFTYAYGTQLNDDSVFSSSRVLACPCVSPLLFVMVMASRIGITAKDAHHLPVTTDLGQKVFNYLITTAHQNPSNSVVSPTLSFSIAISQMSTYSVVPILELRISQH